MPVFMKNIINNISSGIFSPLISFGNLVLFGASNLLMTFFDGKKIITNTKLIQSAWYKMAIKAYDKLQDLDIEY